MQPLSSTALVAGLYPMNYQVENTVIPSGVTFEEVMLLKGAVNV
jgi:hypothetical protein